MQIVKILNNNAAVVLDAKEQETIVMGRGICFQKRTGDRLLEEQVDKIFSLSTKEASSKFQALVKDVPMEHMALGEKIVKEAELRLNKKLNDMIYISLIDHVYTSIVRFLDGITVKNVLLWDIRRFYREEFKIGEWALRQIAEEFKVELPEDEAGFIALHIANAEMDEKEMHNMYEITRIIQEILNIVKYFFYVEFDAEDVYYDRFVTHLKFFAKRLVEKHIYDSGENDGFLEVIRVRYGKSFECVEKITDFIFKKYNYKLSGDETLYLVIHIEQAIHRIKK